MRRWRPRGGEGLEELEEFVELQASLLQDVGERGTLDGPVSWKDDLQGLFGRSLLEANVATTLADDDPAIAVQGVKNALEIEAGDLAQTAISRTSASGAKSQSSSTGSR